MSQSRGAPPPALPPWLVLLFLLAAPAPALSDDGAPSGPAALDSPVSSSTAGLLQEPLQEGEGNPESDNDNEDGGGLDGFLREDRAARDNFLRFGKAAHDNFMRFGRAPHDNFMRFGRAPHDNFMRFGKSGRDNFLRFGKSPHDNFMRFGRAGRDNFLRFGRAGRDNFLRFGKAGRDNFLRFGRAGRDNFLRFGKSPRDNFLRFGREPDGDFERDVGDRGSTNFLRLGRGGEGPDTDLSLEQAALAAELSHKDVSAEDDTVASSSSEDAYSRDARDRNFLRFGRDPAASAPAPASAAATAPAALDADEDDAEEVNSVGEPEARAEAEAEAGGGGGRSPGAEGEAASAVGAGAGDDAHMRRVGRALRPRSLFGRWKMSDLNFIRLGRSAPDGPAGLMPPPGKRSGHAPRAGRSSQGGRPDNYVDNFIRLGNGKRAGELVRAARSVPAAPTSAPAAPHRAKRGIEPSSSDCKDRPSLTSLLPELPLSPLGYYSPLAVGLPNYLFAPEYFSRSRAPAAVKRADRQGSNFIRLG